MRIEYDRAVLKVLDKLDSGVRRRILRFLDERVAHLKNPREIGGALKGSEFGEFWKYRVGDYRIIVKILDNELIVLVLRIRHRREIYK